jgi:hypothetical protein
VSDLRDNTPLRIKKITSMGDQYYKQVKAIADHIKKHRRENNPTPSSGNSRL